MVARKNNLEQFGKIRLKDLEVERNRQGHCTPILTYFSDFLSAQFVSSVLSHSLTKHFEGKEGELMTLFGPLDLLYLKSLYF